MSDNTFNAANVLADHYRCPESYGAFSVAAGLSATPGYFRFGKDTVCFGRTSTGSLRNCANSDLDDVLGHVTIRERDTTLPFDPNEAIDNLRYERYMTRCHNGPTRFVREAYYRFRPWMPAGFRKHLQRIYLNRWQEIAFPNWPVDRTVENIFEKTVTLSMESHGTRQMPFVWFWPSGYSGCLILTHDVETEAGRDVCAQLADTDASFGMKSSFQIVPEDRYEVTPSFLASLLARGCELNVHGLNHDGQLFRDRKTFLGQVERINRYGKEYGAYGFRSPVLYRNLDWYADLEFSYDMSVPNVAHLDPQRGGCCTVMPYFVGNIVELPLTTTQDWSLFNILKHDSVELWKQQIDMVLEKHGLVSFNIHPDYIMADPFRKLYHQLLEHLAKICAERNVWMALPREVDLWWRQRREMTLVNRGNLFHVSGPSSERAAPAYACQDGEHVVYEFPDRRAANPRGAATHEESTVREVTL
ncbi:MAG TPA: hypothetical protein VE422_29265 [Terriglobia bacterium]|nr:hypothetical protein [Terriglobia bacterium]